MMAPEAESRREGGGHHCGVVQLTLGVFLMVYGFQQIVTQAIRRSNGLGHGLPPRQGTQECFTLQVEEEAHGFNRWQLGLKYNRDNALIKIAFFLGISFALFPHFGDLT
jgi:hypothetical protein